MSCGSERERGGGGPQQAILENVVHKWIFRVLVCILNNLVGYTKLFFNPQQEITQKDKTINIFQYTFTILKSTLIEGVLCPGKKIFCTNCSKFVVNSN